MNPLSGHFNQYIWVALIVVAIFTCYMALVHFFRRDALRSRVMGAARGALASDEEATPSALAAFCENILGLIGADPRAHNKEMALMLAKAGLHSPNAIIYYLFFKKIVQPIFLVIGVVFIIRIMMSGDTGMGMKLAKLLVGGIIALIGLYGADLYITNRRQKYQATLLLSFPEALDLLLVCIESGLALDGALNRVCQEMRLTHPEITAELDRTRIELTMLNDRSQALQNLAERTEVIAFKSLVASLIQTEKFGTSLVDTLRVLSDDQRITRLMTAENKAARIPVLITIPLIFCMMPAFVLIILAPPFIQVADQGGIFGPAQSSR